MEEFHEAVKEVLHNQYRIQVSDLKLLDGMCDRTFLVNNDRYVLKVFLDPIAADKRQIEAEIALILYFKDRGFPVASLIPTRTGALHTEAEFWDKDKKQKVTRSVRLQTYLRGALWFKKETNVEISETAGQFIGKIDKALETFRNPFYLERANFFYVVKCSETWDAYKLKELVKDDPRVYKLCDKALQLFDDQVVPRIEQLPKQQIHGDCHSRNIMVDDDCKRIIGLIDFTDSRFMLRVYEPAITIPVLIGSDSPDYACVRAFMKGYKTQVRVTDVELDVLRICVCGRIVMAMLCSKLFAMESPETYDESYMFAMYGPAWDNLDDLLNNDEKIAKFEAAIRGL